ncbi:MAG TPA: hypothetical protein VFZ41_06315 [Solirubrobacterales bacterium]
MRQAGAIAAIALLAALIVAGCGSDSGEDEPRGPGDSGEVTQPSGASANQGSDSGPSGVRAESCEVEGGEFVALRAVEEDCETARVVAEEWSHRASCSEPEGGSRFACTVRGYRCLGTTAGRGIAVSCARPGRSISFLADPR